MALTRRCPLACRHCSTNSLMNLPNNPVEPFVQLVDTFTAEEHPELVLMSGGEALLQAETVRKIAQRSRAVGTRSYVLSGMYFARESRIPTPIKRAIDSVDHFAASIDAFHEEEVERSAVIEVLRQLMSEGKDVSIQIVGLDDEDPYLEEAIDDLRTSLDDRVPILVGHVNSAGRAAEWLHHDAPPVLASSAATPSPCAMASWPLVRFDGNIIACCNQDVVDVDVIPEHLLIGNARHDSWESVRERTLTRELMRAVRLIGPEALAARTDRCSPGYCGTCMTLSHDHLAKERAKELVESPSISRLESAMGSMLATGGAAAFVRNYGSPRYAELVLLGQDRRSVTCAG
ncbi:radical SAM protein [Streptomyces chartreusis]|uniref:radical SAM protein n=1 Tax=Streptomyces chartreusis TaxID=1969 RepID=UPI003806B131